jgi:hypothetical protein
MTISKTTPYLNSRLKKTENGAKILILEDKATGSNADSHPQKATENAQRAVPETNIYMMNRITRDPSPKATSSIQNYIIEKTITCYDSYALSFEKIAKEKDPPNAISISQSISEFTLLKEIVNKQSLFYKIATTKEKERLFWGTDEKNIDLNVPQTETYIDESLEAGKAEINQSKSKLEAQVAKLKKEKNIAVLTSVGNYADDLAYMKEKYPDLRKHNKMFMPIEFEKNEGENFLAGVKGVIGVGASKDDGTLKEFSSRGEHTVLTLAEPYSDQGDSGTSFTTPAATAKVADLINKGMTVDRAIKTLKDQGKKMTNEEGDTYTFLPPELFSGRENYGTGISKQDRPSTQLENKKKGDVLNTGENERA